jgi:hypothetical protein
MMREHRGSAAAPAAADPCSRRSPADAVAARAVQAGAALTLFEMAAWRLEGALADAGARARLAAALEVELAPRKLAAAASHLRWLLSLLCGPAAPAADAPRSPATACVDLLVLLHRKLTPDAAASPLGRGARAVLRSLASAEGLQSSVADLARLHGVAPARVLVALEELATVGCAVLSPPLEHSSETVMLTPESTLLAEADPLGAAVSRAQQGLDEEALWRLVQLGGALLRVEALRDASDDGSDGLHREA